MLFDYPEDSAPEAMHRKVIDQKTLHYELVNQDLLHCETVDRKALHHEPRQCTAWPRPWAAKPCSGKRRCCRRPHKRLSCREYRMLCRKPWKLYHEHIWSPATYLIFLGIKIDTIRGLLWLKYPD